MPFFCIFADKIFECSRNKMLFNSFAFLIFLPVVFCLYWLLRQHRHWQNLLVVVASYVFYGWWDWRFLLLIAFTSLCSFGSGILMEAYNGQRQRQKWVSIANIVINIGILGVFKYYDFFADGISRLLYTAFGYQIDYVSLHIVLPVGISFYTFQALSYSIDVYRQQIRATHDPVEFFAYISFFPQLVAGPIERATHLLPQFQKNRCFDYQKAADGCRQMLWGFFKKVFIADSCAADVNAYWNDYASMSGVSVWALAILFAIQIYCDFSGYSDIAIGCSRLFGFDLKQNFRFPYFSRSIPEFWRRWHISLMSWFRDYIYIPLGGSRRRKAVVMRNIFIVWAISGLWHGANWTFVAWGLYHAVLICIYLLLNVNTKRANDDMPLQRRDTPKALLQMSVKFLLVVAGWVVFRAESLEQALGMWNRMFLFPFSGEGVTHGKWHLVFGAAMLAFEWVQRHKEHALQLSGTHLFKYRWVRWAFYYALLVLIAQNVVEQQTFIYFQF